MIKYVDDYLDLLHEKYPTVLKSDIKKIVNFGFRLMFQLVRRGLDIQLLNKDLWFYVGELTNDSLKHFAYYKRKLLFKIRYIFEQKHKWDGYYYTSITDEDYKSLTKKTPKRTVTLHKAVLFKCLDAAKVYYDKRKHFIRVKPIVDLGYSYYKEKVKLSKVKLVYSREKALTLKDLMIDSKNYEIL